MKANTPVERLYNGIIKENPTFVLMLGMCPTLAVTTSAMNGLGMGLTTMVILAMSNMMISMLRKVIPDGVRMPAYIVVVASFVTIVQFLLQGYIPDLYKSLGLYIPLIVVNCIILGRAEAYASKNTVLSSLFDGIGMGLGFTLGLTSIGIVREFIGSGSIFGFEIFEEGVTIFVLAQKVRRRKHARREDAQLVWLRIVRQQEIRRKGEKRHERTVDDCSGRSYGK